MVLYFVGAYISVAILMSLFVPAKPGHVVDASGHVFAGLLWPLVLVAAFVIWVRQRL